MACAVSLIMWIVITSLYANADKTLTVQWNAGLIEQTAENIVAYEMSKMVCRGFVIIGTFMIVEQLGSLFFGVMILLKRRGQFRSVVCCILSTRCYILLAETLSAA